MSTVIIIEDFTINDRICISLNNEINYNNINLGLLKQSFINNMTNIIKVHKVHEDNGLIFLVDYNKIDFKNISLKRVKCIIHLMMEKFPNKLYKCIFYNTNKTFKTFISLIKVFLDKVTAAKIVVRKDVSDIISHMKNDLNIIQTDNS